MNIKIFKWADCQQRQALLEFGNTIVK